MYQATIYSLKLLYFMFLIPHPFDSPDWVIFINAQICRITASYHREDKSAETEGKFAISIAVLNDS